MQLSSLGWDSIFASSFETHAREGLVPARVTADLGPLFRLMGADGERLGEPSGRLRHGAASRAELPAVGDWVAVRPQPGARAVIHAVLPRRTCFSRKTAGATVEQQVVAANVDTVFLMTGLDGDFNPRRIERALLLAWESGATPVVVLNKADLCDDVDARVREVEALALGVPVVVVSAAEGAGLRALEAWLAPGRTVALLGSTGVGKSTLTNRLLGEERQATRAVRAGDDRGRHTTTRRELIALPGGAVLLDTPGMRELSLWAGDEGLRAAFDDVETLARGCAFRDCSHQAEPRCAVRAAVSDGRLPGERLASYFKLQAELRSLHVRQDLGAQADERRRWKAIHKAARKHRPRE
jgi:ribosome biogenesis GTPase